MPIIRCHTITDPENPCYQLGNINRKFCLPIKRDCTPTATDYILAKCGQRWCDIATNRDIPYFMKWEAGDTLMFQYWFDDNYNDPADEPLAGWHDFVIGTFYNWDGTVIVTGSDIDPYVTQKMVGVIDGKSYQMIQINTQALFDAEIFCWYFSVTPYDTEGNATADAICTQDYGYMRCKTSIIVQGVYDKYDCKGNWYGDADYVLGDTFKYDNSQRFDGYLLDSGASFEHEITANKVKSTESKQIWTLYLRGLVPAYVKNLLYLQLLNAPKVFIDDEEYSKKGGEVSVFEGTAMFGIEQEMYKSCQSGTNNC